jgi:hypothetical protein
VWGAAAGVVIVFVYLRHRSAAAATGNTITPVAAPTVDPNTGQLIDPLTGQPYITSAGTQNLNTNESWMTAAFQYLTAHNFSPALAAQALYDYLNGNTLSNLESGAVNAALGGVGLPPNPGPYLGNIPPTPGNKPVIPRPPFTFGSAPLTNPDANSRLGFVRRVAA